MNRCPPAEVSERREERIDDALAVGIADKVAVRIGCLRFGQARTCVVADEAEANVVLC